MFFKFTPLFLSLVLLSSNNIAANVSASTVNDQSDRVESPTGNLVIAESINVSDSNDVQVVTDALVSQDGRQFYTLVKEPHAFNIYDKNLETGNLTLNYSFTADMAGLDALKTATGIIASPDGRNIVLISQDTTALMQFNRDPETGDVIYYETAVIDHGSLPSDQPTGFDRMAISPSGEDVLLGGYKTDTLYHYDRHPDTFDMTYRAAIQATGALDDEVAIPGTLIFNATGDQAFATLHDAIQILDNIDGRITRSQSIPIESPTDIVLSPSGKQLAVTDKTSHRITLLVQGDNQRWVPCCELRSDRSVTTGLQLSVGIDDIPYTITSTNGKLLMAQAPVDDSQGNLSPGDVSVGDEALNKANIFYVHQMSGRGSITIVKQNSLILAGIHFNGIESVYLSEPPGGLPPSSNSIVSPEFLDTSIISSGLYRESNEVIDFIGVENALTMTEIDNITPIVFTPVSIESVVFDINDLTLESVEVTDSYDTGFDSRVEPVIEVGMNDLTLTEIESVATADSVVDSQGSQFNSQVETVIEADTRVKEKSLTAAGSTSRLLIYLLLAALIVRKSVLGLNSQE